jgi:hypothetical protein
MIDVAQGKIVREIFQRYADGASLQRIAADLNKREIPSRGASRKRTKRRCGGWAWSGIWAMLRNPLYVGTYMWKRCRWLKTETGRLVKVRQDAEWLGAEGNKSHWLALRAVWGR